MCVSPVFKKNKDGSIIKFPCGGCMGCRIDSLLLWTARCESEMVNTRSSFVTLTYNDLWLNERCFPNKQFQPSLIREDFNKFIDRLRVKCKRMSFFPAGCKRDFRYFGCGEYGENGLRSHYHVLLFGLDFHDCKKIIESCWRYGFAKVLPILNGGVRYVVDYFTKNQTGEHAKELYDDNKIERPFKSCSKGLGFSFFYSHRDEISKTGCVKIGSRTIFVPSYYSNLFCNFSSETVEGRLFQRFQLSKELEREGSSFGFPSLSDYQKYLRRSLADSLTTKFRDKGSPVDSHYSLQSSFDSKSLVSEVENILSFGGN